MRRPTIILILVSVAIAATVVKSLIAVQPIPRDVVENDLALKVALVTSATIEPGDPVRLDASLVNTSSESAYPVVRPGDGSEAGWREPHVFYTAERELPEGSWEAVPAARYGRCGLFDHQWQDEVTRLGPGAELPLKDWLPWPSEMLEMQRPGRVRLRVHYRYNAGGAGKGGRGADSPHLGDMAGVEPFEIVSEPMELRIVRPLDIEVDVKAAMRVGDTSRLSELIGVTLVNRSDSVREVVLPSDNALRFEIVGKAGGWRPNLAEQVTQGDGKSLGPGERVSLLGGDRGLDGVWEYPMEDRVRLRAVYYRTNSAGGSPLISEWVEVEVSPTTQGESQPSP